MLSEMSCCCQTHESPARVTFLSAVALIQGPSSKTHEDFAMSSLDLTVKPYSCFQTGTGVQTLMMTINKKH